MFSWLALSDWGTRPRIELLSMDGGKRQIMVDKDMIHPKGLAFNPKNQRLYWVDTAKETIESVVVQSREQQRHVLKMDHDLKLSDIAVYGVRSLKVIDIAFSKVISKSHCSVHVDTYQS